MKLVVLTGIPGSGSTTLLNKALEEVDYVHINYGDIMSKIAIERGLVEDRDAMRKLPAETQKEIQAEAAKEIKRRSENDNVNSPLSPSHSTAVRLLQLMNPH